MKSIVALGLSGALAALSGLPTPALASPPFIERPTIAYACEAREIRALGPAAWTGVFHGSRDSDIGGFGRGPFGRDHKETAFLQKCFRSERECRNWLYNMQSEFRQDIWTAVCKRGIIN
jgi:hypothetical protein